MLNTRNICKHFLLKSIYKKTLQNQLNRFSSKLAYYNQIGSTPLIYRTLGNEIEIAAEKYHNREFFVACNENKRLTYSEALNEADLLASQFIKLNFQKGDHIALWAPNTYQWVISFLALARAGLILVCINPALKAQEIKYCLKKAKCKAIIAPEVFKNQNYYEILKEVLPTELSQNEITSKELPYMKTIIIDSSDNLEGVYKFQDLLSSSIDSKEIKKLQATISPDDSLNIQFTSGTTGVPKAAILTHFNFVNCSKIFGHQIGLANYDHRVLCQVPFYHVFGLSTLIASMQYGATLIASYPLFNAVESLKTVEKEKCTLINGTPTMFVDNLVAQSKHNYNVESLKIGITGGSTCTPQIFHDIKTTFGLDKMKIAYGLSEGTAAVFGQTGDEPDAVLENTVGKVYRHLEAKVIDDNGKIVNFGEPGELCLRGYTTMKGYFEDEDKTKEVLADDKWLKTGDKFTLEETGYASIIGRKKDMINRGGENVFPKEIEDFLDTHPDVLESQVIGVPDDRMGEEICAFIRIKNGRQDLKQDDIKTFFDGKIAHFKIPKYIRIINEFPKTTSGKIQKFKLKEIFNKK